MEGLRVRFLAHALISLSLCLCLSLCLSLSLSVCLSVCLSVSLSLHLADPPALPMSSPVPLSISPFLLIFRAAGLWAFVQNYATAGHVIESEAAVCKNDESVQRFCRLRLHVSPNFNLCYANSTTTITTTTTTTTNNNNERFMTHEHLR